MSNATRSFEKHQQEIAQQIYAAYLPEYLQEPWSGGRGNGYEDWLKKQLDILVMSEIYNDECRLSELENLQEKVSLIFGLFGATFRILDHIGMHLRGQTFGQYELLPDDEELLRDLCQRFLQMEHLDLDLFWAIPKDTEPL